MRRARAVTDPEAAIVARQLYESWEFEPSPTDSYHLFLMLKDLKALLAG